MSTDWTSLRIGRQTVQRLEVIRERMIRSARSRPRKANPKLLEPQVGLGDVVAELAYLYERDAARQRYYTRKHREEQLPEAIQLPMPEPQEIQRFLDDGGPPVQE